MTIPFLTPRPVESGGAAAPGSGGVHADLVLTITCQEEDRWCWAAVAQAVEDWKRITTSQSEIASHHIAPGGGLVCATPLGQNTGSMCQACGEQCGGSHILSAVLNERGRLASAPRNNPPSFSELQTAIDANRPVPLRIDWGDSANSGHFICVIGYSKDSADRQWVTIFDPLSPGEGHGPADPLIMRFDDLVGIETYAAPSGSGGTLNFTYEVH